VAATGSAGEIPASGSRHAGLHLQDRRGASIEAPRRFTISKGRSREATLFRTSHSW
jgi:hypothetical protein